MSTITVKDGTTIYYKDWGKGPVVTFSHGWPLCSDAWDGQMHFLAENGFRAVAHDHPDQLVSMNDFPSGVYQFIDSQCADLVCVSDEIIIG